MSIKHFCKDGETKPACGAGKHSTYSAITYGTFLVECPRCQRTQAYKDALRRDLESEAVKRAQRESVGPNALVEKL